MDRACSVSIGKVTNPRIRSSTYPPWGGETSRDGIDFSPDVSRDDSTGKVGEIVSSYETVRVLSSCEHGGTVSAGKVFSSGWSKLNNTLYSHGILNPSLYSRFRFHLFFFSSFPIDLWTLGYFYFSNLVVDLQRK